jgi:hypothetical protein
LKTNVKIAEIGDSLSYLFWGFLGSPKKYHSTTILFNIRLGRETGIMGVNLLPKELGSAK